MAHALSYAKEQLQVRRVSLGVNALNPAAIGLYERFGFQQFGFERCFMLVDGEPQDEIQMVCVLEPDG